MAWNTGPHWQTNGLNAAIQENLIAIRVVKAFVRADFEKKKFRKANDENMEMPRYG